jgi:hypothetical protein
MKKTIRAAAVISDEAESTVDDHVFYDASFHFFTLLSENPRGGRAVLQRVQAETKPVAPTRRHAVEMSYTFDFVDQQFGLNGESGISD